MFLLHVERNLKMIIYNLKGSKKYAHWALNYLVSAMHKDSDINI